MPLVKCTKDGKSGWKFGQNNTSCFTGPNGKKDAIKQAIKIYGPEEFKKHMESGFAEENKSELIDLLQTDKELSEIEVEMITQALKLSIAEVMAIINIRDKL
jgi:hypothetical protein